MYIVIRKNFNIISVSRYLKLWKITNKNLSSYPQSYRIKDSHFFFCIILFFNDTFAAIYADDSII